MSIAWILFASTGILFASKWKYYELKLYNKTTLVFFSSLKRIGYFKFIFPGIKTFGVQFWFNMHRLLMSSVTLFSLIGLVLILFYKKWTWTSSKLEIRFAHSIIGILAISFSFIQVSFFAFFWLSSIRIKI